MRYKWILLMCVGVILVQVTFANSVGSPVAEQDNLGEGDDTGPQKSRSHAYEEQLSDTNKGDRIGLSSSDSSIRDANENSNVDDRAGLNTPENSNRTSKKNNVTGLNRLRKSNVSITTTEKPSTICTKSGLNYDCILQNLLLSTSENSNFGLTWKNNPQKNVSFEDSRLAYLPKKLFEAFPQMELLNAESLQIEEIEDRAFSNAKKLKYLFLKDNRITAIHGFQGVPWLVHLDVSYNRINFIHENAFKNNKRLQRILMNNNFISELPNTDTISNLQIVNVTNNEISQISDHQFSKNYNLRHLDVSFNNLSYFNLNHLGDNRVLSFIDVSHNYLNSLYIPMNVNFLKAANNSIKTIAVSKCSLEKLDLSRNQITDATVLQTCSQLKILNLSHNKLQYFDLIDSFSSLIDLNLANNHLFEITFPTNVHLLQHLDLSNNRLSFGPLNKFFELNSLKLNNNEFIEFKFSNMQKLNFILMSNNKWSCEKIEDIMKTGIVADANEACRESQSRNGICCKNYIRSYSDRLKEMVRETFIHENVNTKQKCDQAKTGSKVHRKSQNELQRELEQFDEVIQKFRRHYGVSYDSSGNSTTKLNRVLQHVKARNIFKSELLTRRIQEKNDKSEQLISLNSTATAITKENKTLKATLAEAKLKDAALKKERLRLEKTRRYSQRRS